MSVYLSELSKTRPAAKTRKSRFWIHIAILLLLGCYLRAWSILNESPSFEEIRAALVVEIPFDEYMSHPQPDFAPPVFYAISHPVAAATLNLGALRVIAIIAGALSPLALYLVGRRLYGEPAAVIGAYLLALNPLHIYYSQEFQPSVLFALLSLGGFLAMVRSAESNRWKDWLVYDLIAVLLLHTQREAAFFVAAFPVIQMCRALFFPPVNQERRIHRFKLVQGILLNHFIILAVSIPWLWIMTNKLPWDLGVPKPSDLFQIFGQLYLFGFTGWRPLAPWLVMLLLVLLLLPPLLKMLRRLDFRTFAAITTMILAIALPFTYSLFETPRFISAREGFTALPYFCLSLGILLARCNWVVKTSLTAFFTIIFLAASINQARTLQKTATTDMLNNIIRDGAKADDIVAFWPSYTLAMGEFWKDYYDRSFNIVTVRELLKTWAELPPDRPIYFVVSQFPDNSTHLYTMQGALTQYATSEVLWQNRLNMVIKATDLDQRTLAQWYDEPRSLKILDQPTSNTQFIFTAADPVFKPDIETSKTQSMADWPFASDRTDLSYDPTGHRFVWTTKPTAMLELPVTLAPGNYLLRLHCSPDFDQPEFGRYKDRKVSLTLRTGEDQRQVLLENAQTINVPFTTDVELQRLPISISVDKMHEIAPPAGGSFGVKIYSISIDQDNPTPNNQEF